MNIGLCTVNERRSLSPGSVHVWLAQPGAIDEPALLTAYARLLDSGETERHRRFRFERHRHTFLVAHALMRTTLSRYADVAPGQWRFRTNDYGRPEIANIETDLRFNLSHTEGLVACAVSRGAEVGVDVESYARRSIDVRVADRFFAAPETRTLKTLPVEQQAERFLQYWTLKESYIKARGMGLALPLGGFAFSLAEQRDPRIEFFAGIDDDPARWVFKLLHPIPGFVLAIATENTPAAREPEVIETVPLLR